jgi:hypothetical protein
MPFPPLHSMAEEIRFIALYMIYIVIYELSDLM